jgi:hypothetical protein
MINIKYFLGSLKSITFEEKNNTQFELNNTNKNITFCKAFRNKCFIFVHKIKNRFQKDNNKSKNKNRIFIFC